MTVLKLNLFQNLSFKYKQVAGDAGYRSPYFSHAKRALYHLSYTPYHPTGSFFYMKRPIY
jgi:hypothetical protein